MAGSAISRYALAVHALVEFGSYPALAWLILRKQIQACASCLAMHVCIVLRSLRG